MCDPFYSVSRQLLLKPWVLQHNISSYRLLQAILSSPPGYIRGMDIFEVIKTEGSYSFQEPTHHRYIVHSNITETMVITV